MQGQGASLLLGHLLLDLCELGRHGGVFLVSMDYFCFSLLQGYNSAKAERPDPGCIDLKAESTSRQETPSRAGRPEGTPGTRLTALVRRHLHCTCLISFDTSRPPSIEISSAVPPYLQGMDT